MTGAISASEYMVRCLTCLCLLGVGCERYLVVTVSGQGPDVPALQATVTVGGKEVQPIDEFAGSTERLGLRLPAGEELAPVVVELDGLDDLRCTRARGIATGVLAAEALSLHIPLERLAAPACCNAAGICWETPLPTAGDLRGAFSVGAGDAWVVGLGGNLWHLRSTGLALAQGVPNAHLYGVWGSGPADVWAVGDAGAILHHDGESWRAVEPPGAFAWRAVWGSGPADVWAVGAEGMGAHFDGNTWQAVRIDAGARELRGIWGTSGSDVWAVGVRSALLHYDGASWSEVAPPMAVNLNAVHGGPEAVWAVGDGPVVLRLLAGVWRPVSFPGPGPLRGVWRRAANEVWVVGPQVHRHDGAAWRHVPEADGGEQQAVTADERSVVVAGRMGLLRELPGGAAIGTWRTHSPAPSGLGLISLRGVWGEGPDALWAVGLAMEADGKPRGNEGVIAQYNGRGWTVVKRMGGRLRGIWGRRADDIWAVGGLDATVFHYDGARWLPEDAPGSEPLYGIGGEGGLRWAVGGGGIILRGQGTGWERQKSPTGNSLLGVWVGGGEAWIVGSAGTVLRYQEEAWQVDEQAAARLRAWAMGRPLPALRAVWGSGPEDLWVGGDGGVLMRRTQGAWLPPVVPQSSVAVDAIWTSGPKDVWVVGGGLDEDFGSVLLHGDGDGWSLLGTGAEGISLHGVFGLGQRVWTVGSYGVILRRRGF